MWQYKHIKSRSNTLEETELNKLGEDDWELVNFAIVHNSHYDYVDFYYIFKKKSTGFSY
jgi:hypothetical protein